MATYATIISSTSSLETAAVGASSSGSATYTVPDGACIKSLFSYGISGTRNSGGGLGITVYVTVKEPTYGITIYTATTITENTAGNGVHSMSAVMSGTPPTNIPEGSIITVFVSSDAQWSGSVGKVSFFMEENS